MAKFKVLNDHGKILMQLGIFENPAPEKEKQIIGSFKSAIVYFGLFIMVTFIASCILFLCEHLEQFNTALRSCIFIVGASQATCMFIGFRLNAANVQEVHLKFQELVDGIEGNCVLPLILY